MRVLTMGASDLVRFGAFGSVETVFGTEVTGTATSRLIQAASLAILSAATGATFISPSRARTSAVRPG